jgi:hypothetical protein
MRDDMSDAKLENRMADLEKEVEVLRQQVQALTSSKRWWDKIAGTFEQDPVYRRAMNLGRKYRRAQGTNGTRSRN